MREDIPQTLLGLLRTYSPSGHESAAVNWLVQHMQTLGMQAHVDAAGNAVGTIGTGARHLLLLGHIDTVPGEIAVRVEGELLYGRGAVDAKGALAAFVDAAAAGAVPDLTITVIGAVGEEAASPGAMHLCTHFARPDFLLVGEPSGWERITLGYKGSAWFELKVRRAITHSAGEAASAPEQAAAAWQRLLQWAGEFNKGRERTFDQVTPLLRSMHSENDGLEETAQLQICLRLPEGMLTAVADDVVRMLSGADITVAARGAALPAYRAGKNTPLVRAALAAVRAAGGQPQFVLKTGTSDLNILGPLWNCPAAAYGPGDAALDHTPHEHLSLPEYARSVTVLRTLIENLATPSSYNL
ncbi:MAG: [LysW]-lysine hydrolase [Chloroflexi bacterium]|nr:MAG: [LysW]-lysine hydrolase [Chloroflexota bacterium]